MKFIIDLVYKLKAKSIKITKKIKLIDYNFQSIVFTDVFIGIIILFSCTIYFLIAYHLSSQGLPLHPNIDELIITTAGQRMFLDSTWTDIATFVAPQLSKYIAKIGLICFSVIGIDVAVNPIFYMRLFFSVLQGLSYICFFWGAYIFFDKNKISALIAFLVAIFSLYPFRFLFYVYPDKLLFTLSNVLFLFMSLLYREHNKKSIIQYYYIIAIIIGLMFSTKYNGFFPIVFLYAIYIYNSYSKSVSYKIVLLSSTILVGVVFILINWNMFLSIEMLRKFFENFQGNIIHYKNGHFGIDSNNSFIFYIKYFLFSSYGIFGGLVFIVGLFLLIKSKKLSEVCFICFLPILFILIQGRYKVALERNIASVMPFFTIGVVAYIHYIKNIQIRRLVSVIVILFCFVNCIIMIVYTTRDSTFVRAEQWIDSNIPHGSEIVISSHFSSGYFPYINPEKYSVIHAKEVWFLPVDSSQYVIQSSFLNSYPYNTKDYLNPFRHRWLYPDLKRKYDEYLSTFFLVKTFSGLTPWVHSDEFNYLKLLKNLFNRDMSLFNTISIYIKK